MEEDDGAPSGRSSPPTPKKVKLESEEPKELLKAEDHSEDESEEIEEDEDEEEDGDGSPQLPPLLDMIDLPPASTLPPTPPLPSSPRDLNMEQQDSEDEGPPPGWDNTYQLQEQVEHMLTPAAVSAISSDISDIRMEDLQQDGRNGEDAAPELIASDMKVEEQDSEDEGPPPGWDSKCLPETELQVAYPQITQSDIKTEDLQEDIRNGNGATTAPELVPSVNSDMKVEEQDSEEDERPPPGWDSKCQPEPELQMPFPTPTITQSDMKTEEVQQDAPQPQLVLVPSDMKVEEQDSEEDEGPPPGWDSKGQPQPKSTDMQTEDAQQDAWNGQHPTPQPQLVLSDVKVEEQDSEEDEGPPPGWDQPQPESTDIKTTEEIQHDVQNGDGPQPQPQQPHDGPAPALELAPSGCEKSAIKVEEQDSETDEGAPPGWDSKCTPPSESKIEDDQQKQQDEDGQGQGQGWGSSSTPQPPPPHSIGERMGTEFEQKQKNVEAAVVVELERPQSQPQPPSRQQPPSTTTKKTNNPIPEMGQMVCGSCRRLLSYPKGARYVECGCCLEENYVLEEHEVGQVICGGCDVLLMYPYGAPKVRCVNCSTETEIGDQNRRPPLSEQQRRARRHLRRVQTGFKY
ncbi:uncharacterized protein LOC111892692 isoform X2 [Lactuca sativa]|uniref:uncharacterized protein LOC111892692 isoform X2 n=1 Tax=Lactuca sativa TaxID=4236 RepID=UPI000CD98947|nr:uncharacterized protein LOC111892692 isoform X2 [Lactuca sativa]